MVYGEVTRVILMYVDTADCYKVPQSGASIGEQARQNKSLSFFHRSSPITIHCISSLFCATSDTLIFAVTSDTS